MAARTSKQYLKIDKKTVLEHTIAVFLSHPQIGKIVIVLHPDDQKFNTLPVASNPRIETVIGGNERVDSVLAGLHYLTDELLDKTSFVLVHDGARPCVNQQDISRLIAQCQVLQTSKPQTITVTGAGNTPKLDSNICGAILACPVADTIKKSRPSNPPNHTIDHTVDRSLLWQAQTPQMFKINELIEAILTSQIKGAVITDEASAMENTGKEVMLVEGPSSNLKITRPSDLALAAFYLSNNVNTVY